MGKSRVEDAVKLFYEGYNCCQSVVGAYSDLFGMDREQAMKMSCSLGGGMARMREVCGAVSGMALVAGLACGNTDPKNQAAKTHNYETVRGMAEKFKQEHQTIICREILGLRAAEKSAAPAERTQEYYKNRPCARMVETAARIVEETFPELFAKEMLPLLDEDGRETGVCERDKAHEEGLWHPVVHCWMYAEQDGQVWLYFQKRAHEHVDFPDFYDIAAAGHIGAGETHAQAVVRECREEVGISPEPDHLHYLGEVKEELRTEKMWDREIAHVYLYKLDVPFFAPGEEVQEIIAVSLEEFQKKVQSAPYIQGHSLYGEPIFIREEEWCSHRDEYVRLIGPFLENAAGKR